MPYIRSPFVFQAACDCRRIDDRLILASPFEIFTNSRLNLHPGEGNKLNCIKFLLSFRT